MNIRDEWSTPQGLFDVIDAEFDFNMDVCATAANAKCGRFNSLPWQNGLKSEWGWVNWCNPPYSHIGPWLATGIEMQRAQGRLSVFLLPVDVSTRWWAEYVWLATELRFLVGKRVQFDAPAGVNRSSNTGSSVLAIYRPGSPSRLSNGPWVRWWDWSTEVSA